MINNLLFKLAIHSSCKSIRSIVVQILCWLEYDLMKPEQLVLPDEGGRKATKQKVISLPKQLKQRLKIQTLTYLLNQPFFEKNIGRF